MQFLFADPPSWEDDPGGYQFTSFIVAGLVQSDGENIGGFTDLVQLNPEDLR